MSHPVGSNTSEAPYVGGFFLPNAFGRWITSGDYPEVVATKR